MMENANLDIITDNMMANSGLEISNAGFNSIIMNKIMQKKKRKSVSRYIIFCSLLIVAVSALIILMLRPGQSANALLPPAFDSFSNSMVINMTKTGNRIMGIMIFIVPVVVLLFFKNLIDSAFRQSETLHKH